MVDRDSLLHDAREDLLQSRFGQAKQRYQELLRADAIDPDALIGLTRVALGEGDLAEAQRQADRVLAEQPEHLDGQILRLLVVEAEGDGAAALAGMQRLAERHPSSCQCSYHVGRLLAASGRGEQALPWLERAAEQADRNRHRYAIVNLIGYVQQELGRLGDAVSSHQRAVALSAKRPQGYVALADALARGGDVQAGLTILEEAELRIGERSELQRKRIELLATRGDLPAARAAARRLGERHPDDATAWLTLARLCLAEQDFEEATEAATRSRNAAPGWWQPHYQLGLCHDALDDRTQAEAAYREARRLAPDAWQPANGLGLVLLCHGTESSDREAAELFAAAAEAAAGDDPSPRINLALALARLPDRNDECLRLCDELLKQPLPAPQRERLKAIAAELRS